MKKIIKYICEKLIPSFGLICLLGAGNSATFIFGIVISILSFYWFYKKGN